MAASEDMQDHQELTTDIESTATKTSLEELKEMLVDIQINIANIFFENMKTLGMRWLSSQLFGNRSSKSQQCSDAEYELAAPKKRVNEQKDKIIYMNYMSHRTDWNNIQGKILLNTWCARERMQHDRGGSFEVGRSTQSSHYSSGC